MFYSNEDYRVFDKEVDGVTRYFILYYTKCGRVPAIEITQDLFKLYCNEFRKHFRKKAVCDAKVGMYLNLEDYLEAPHLGSTILSLDSSVEQEVINRVLLSEIEELISQCTEVQQRRFRLRFYEGLTYREAALLEGCDIKVFWESINAVSKKIKKYFQDIHNT